MALEAVRQGLVLLKNLDGALPFSRGDGEGEGGGGVKRVATVGPNANCSIMESSSHSGHGSFDTGLDHP